MQFAVHIQLVAILQMKKSRFKILYSLITVRIQLVVMKCLYTVDWKTLIHWDRRWIALMISSVSAEWPRSVLIQTRCTLLKAYLRSTLKFKGFSISSHSVLYSSYLLLIFVYLSPDKNGISWFQKIILMPKNISMKIDSGEMERFFRLQRWIYQSNKKIYFLSFKHGIS